MLYHSARVCNVRKRENSPQLSLSSLNMQVLMISVRRITMQKLRYLL